MNEVPVSGLVPGLTLELTGRHQLWDMTKTPWRELGPGTRPRVIAISRLPIGRIDRIPYQLILRTLDGAPIDLEVAHGEERVKIVAADPPRGCHLRVSPLLTQHPTTILTPNGPCLVVDSDRVH